jgi:hypothetical protein
MGTYLTWAVLGICALVILIVAFTLFAKDNGRGPGRGRRKDRGDGPHEGPTPGSAP